MYYKLKKDLPWAKAGTIFNCPDKTELTHWYHVWLVWKMLWEPEDEYFVSRSYVSEFPDFFEEYKPSRIWKVWEKVATTSEYYEGKTYYWIITWLHLDIKWKDNRYSASFLPSADNIHESYLREPTYLELKNYFF